MCPRRSILANNDLILTGIILLIAVPPKLCNVVRYSNLDSYIKLLKITQFFQITTLKVRLSLGFIGLTDLAIRCSQFCCRLPFMIINDPFSSLIEYLLR